MHNLHFILINADAAADAASEAEEAIIDWGDEDNWSRIGGIASEDGSDDVENHEDARWGLSLFDGADGIPKACTHFSRAVALLHKSIADPVTFDYTPHTTHPDLRSAFAQLGDMLKAFDPEHGNSLDLWPIGENIKNLSERMCSRRSQDQGEGIPEFYRWQLDQFGLTDMTQQSEGARRYLVFLDMHS